MKRLKKYVLLLKPYIVLEGIICILGLMSSMVALINPVLLQIIIDKVLVESQIYLLKYIFAIFAFFFVLSCLISYANGYIGTYVNQGILKNLKTELFSHMESIRLQEKLDLASGDFVTKINDDTTTVSTYITNIFAAIISYTSNIVVTGFLMFVFDRRLAAIMIAVTLLELLVSIKFTDVVRDNQRAVKNTYSENMNFLNHFFAGFKYIKAYNREMDIKEKYNGILDKIIRLNFKGYYIEYFYEMSLSMLSFIGSCLIYGIGIYFIYQGDMTIGTLFVFDIIAERFNTFATGVVNFNVELQGFLICVERIESLLDLKKDRVATGEIKDSKEYEITFENVSFAYQEEEVLKGVSFSFTSNHIYAVVGDSGCGKSTIVNMLLKFYSPMDGTIKINGTDMEQLSAREIRDKVVAVFQDAVLNDGTIEENIRYGDSKATIDRIEHVAKVCKIHDFIMGLPDGYQTNIGEIGDKISGGQKQRLSLARALLRNGSVYIFDEAFCNMDKVLENEVYNNIVEECRGKLIIIISHNINLISKIQNIIVLKDGMVEAMGEHTTLMRNSVTYKQLCAKGENYE